MLCLTLHPAKENSGGAVGEDPFHVTLAVFFKLGDIAVVARFSEELKEARVLFSHLGNGNRSGRLVGYTVKLPVKLSTFGNSKSATEEVGEVEALKQLLLTEVYFPKEAPRRSKKAINFILQTASAWISTVKPFPIRRER